MIFKKDTRRPGFDFVTYTGEPLDAARNQANKDVVRSRAMRAGHLVRGKTVPDPPSMPSRTRRLSDQVTRFRVGTRKTSKRPKTYNRAQTLLGESDNGRTTSMPLNTQIGPRSMTQDDGRLTLQQAWTAPSAPAQNLPFLEPWISEVGGTAWELLHHYRFHFRNTSVAIHPKKDWFCCFITHPATTHATLTLVSLDRDLNRGRSVSPETVYHRAAALRHARALIANGLQMSDDDLATLAGCVAVLISADSLEGNIDSATKHMIGLRSIVMNGKGMYAFTNNEPLMQWIYWALISYESTWHAPKELPELFCVEEIDGEPETCECVKAGEDCRLEALRLKLGHVVAPEMLEILQQLHHLPQQTLSGELSASVDNKNSRRLYRIEQQLLRTKLPEKEDEWPYTSLVHSAAHLYVSCAARNLPKGSAFVRDLHRKTVQLLQDRLIHASVQPTTNEQRLLLLWASQLAGQCDTNVTDMRWRLVTMALLRKLEITDALELQQLLRTIVWPVEFSRA
jgi:hypothetical protein